MIVMFAGVALCVNSIATEMKFTRISTLGAKSLLRLRHKRNRRQLRFDERQI